MTIYRKPIATRCDGCGEVKPTVQRVSFIGLDDGPDAVVDGAAYLLVGRFCRRCRGDLKDAVQDVAETIGARA